MDRRSFLGVCAATLGTLPSAAHAKQRQIHRIGYLHPTNSQDFAYIAFHQALKDYGYVVGQDLLVEERFAEGNIERLRAMAEELVANHFDIVVAVSPLAIRAARAATKTIPIVMAFSGDDPVKSGFAATLARNAESVADRVGDCSLLRWRDGHDFGDDLPACVHFGRIYDDVASGLGNRRTIDFAKKVLGLR